MCFLRKVSSIQHWSKKKSLHPFSAIFSQKCLFVLESKSHKNSWSVSMWQDDFCTSLIKNVPCLFHSIISPSSRSLGPMIGRRESWLIEWRPSQGQTAAKSFFFSFFFSSFSFFFFFLLTCADKRKQRSSSLIFPSVKVCRGHQDARNPIGEFIYLFIYSY